MSNWRTDAIDADDYELRYGVEAIRRQVEAWLWWDRAQRDAEGIETTDETHFHGPPTWPSHGSLGAWVHTLKKVEEKLRPTPKPVQESML